MKTFITYLKHHLSQSKIYPSIKNIDEFVKYDGEYTNFYFDQLIDDYIEKFVLGQDRKYSQMLIDFSIKAMQFQKDVNEFKFCFHYIGRLYLSYDVGAYKKLFIERIISKYPSWEANVNSKNDIDLVIDFTLPSDKSMFMDYLTPILRQMNEHLVRAPFVMFNVYEDKKNTYISHKVSFN